MGSEYNSDWLVEEVVETGGFGDCEYVVGDLCLAGGEVMGLVGAVMEL
jgi:hypothetical protein